MTFNPEADYIDLNRENDSSLIDLLDRLLETGVVLHGDLTISVANVDLMYVGLKALLCSVETAEKYRLNPPLKPSTDVGMERVE